MAVAQPPAKRRDHQPLRRGCSARSSSPISVMTGCGCGAAVGDGVAAEGEVSTLPALGAGSRTVERRRGAGSSAGAI
jgi:hypothetical protein